MLCRSAAGASVLPHLRCLRAVGFCRLSPASPAHPSSPARLSYRTLHAAYHVLSLSATCTYVLQQLVYAYQEVGDMEKLSRVLFIMLCYVTCVAKQLVFYFDADRIDHLITRLDEQLFNQTRGDRSALLRGTARRAARLQRWYAGCAVATSLLWAAAPVADRLSQRPVDLSFWLPFRTNHPLLFLLALAYSFYTSNLVAVGNTTTDAFMATILDQCKTQFQILQINFESLTQRATAIAKKTGQSYEGVLNKLLIDCIIHYRKITECTDLLENIFGLSLLVQFGVGGWILCMAAYKIVSVNLLSIEFASTMLFIICILTELLLYCFYGNEVTVESSRVVESIYGMEWTRTPPRFRRTLLVLMERAKRPLRPAAGHIIPLTLETYLKILKSSYSFYAVLRQTK